MIIGFAGRCRSGKSELSKICVEHGYELLSFALPLKNLCARVLSITKYELNELKNKKIPIDLTIDENILKMISSTTDIPFEELEKYNGRLIKDVRELLQFIGTDIIREYNKDWHVNEVRKMINESRNYVFDDVRFQNEKKMIEDFGGDVWFVTRTSLEGISNHISETSLTWHNCWNKIIINDNTLQYLRFKWETFLINYKGSCSARDKEFDRILENGLTDKIKETSTLDMMFISEDMFTYLPKDIDQSKIKSMKLNEDGSLVIAYNDDSLEFITNKLLIEDLKRFYKT